MVFRLNENWGGIQRTRSHNPAYFCSLRPLEKNQEECLLPPLLFPISLGTGYRFGADSGIDNSRRKSLLNLW